MTQRIQDTFTHSRTTGEPCFIAYLCAGDPDFDTSLELCRILVEEGVGLLELGIPFSDPLADGLTNQLAAQRALANGMTADRSFQLVREIRKFAPDLPIIFYTYYNLVFARGEKEYVRLAAEAGLDGLLTLDLPPEEADSLVAACQEQDLANVFIVAPTTPPERYALIGKKASGFIYYVSREGVTGERKDLPTNIAESVQNIRQAIDLPVAVGFGISTRPQFEQVGQVADGVVVGSALVNCIARNEGQPEKMKEALRAKARELLGK
ncbi:MAG: tryptophan synthase subunit alpha [Opitutales bacterium]|nr:tryptophan synthase subunit alpha [Opitutales bacterium]MCH8541371.1 tryptophan synthase subunit alpha [Opitutales bacterium]